MNKVLPILSQKSLLERVILLILVYALVVDVTLLFFLLSERVTLLITILGFVVCFVCV